MRVLRVYADKCIACGACMKTCSKTWFKEENESLSRIRFNDNAGVRSLNTCTQCGTCIQVCPTQALVRDKNGVVQLLKEKCTGCLMCVGFCPSASLFHEPTKQAEPFKCVACGACARKCPAGAIELVQHNQSKEN